MPSMLRISWRTGRRRMGPETCARSSVVNGSLRGAKEQRSFKPQAEGSIPSGRISRSTCRAAGFEARALEVAPQVRPADLAGGAPARPPRAAQPAAKTWPHSQRSGQCSTTSSTAHAGNSSRPWPSCPGWAPSERPERSLPRAGRRLPGGSELGGSEELRDERSTWRSNVVILSSWRATLAVRLLHLRLQALVLLGEREQHRYHSLPTPLVDRFGLTPLHTTGFDSASLCPPTN